MCQSLFKYYSPALYFVAYSLAFWFYCSDEYLHFLFLSKCNPFAMKTCPVSSVVLGAEILTSVVETEELVLMIY